MAYKVYIYNDSGNHFQACFDVTGTQTMQEIGAKSLQIQRSTDGENWEEVRTYTSDYYPQMICENTTTHDWWFGHTADTGYYYRIRVELWAKDSRGTGQKTVYSDPVKF